MKRALWEETDRIRELLHSGATMRQIVQVATSDEIEIARTWLTFREPVRNFKPEIRWYYGPTGVGKTQTAMEWLGEDTFIAGGNARFLWEGYDKHSGLLLDDFRKDSLPFHDLLRCLDHREFRLEQGSMRGTRQLISEKIAITCPFHPKELYKGLSEDVGQLLRRIDEIVRVGPEVSLFQRWNIFGSIGCSMFNDRESDRNSRSVLNRVPSR